jgi:hypothetical protein
MLGRYRLPGELAAGRHRLERSRQRRGALEDPVFRSRRSTWRLRALPKTQAMIWRSKRLAVMKRAASKVIVRDMVVVPSRSTRSRR